MTNFCFICNGKLEDENFRSNQASESKSWDYCVNCPNCGHYNITDDAVDYFRDEKNRLDKKRNVISSYLRDYQGTRIDKKVAEKLLNLKE